MADLINIDALADAIIEKLQPKIIQAMQAFSSNKMQAAGVTDDLLTITEAAKYLSIAVTTIYNNPEIPRMKKGKRLYFSKARLVKYIESGKIKSQSENDTEVDDIIKKRKR